MQPAKEDRWNNSMYKKIIINKDKTFEYIINVLLKKTQIIFGFNLFKLQMVILINKYKLILYPIMIIFHNHYFT